MSVPPAMYSAGASLRPACARNANAALRSRGRSRVNGCTAQPLRGVLDRRHDVVVRSAAAQVAAHPVADFLRRAGVAFPNARNARHDLSRRAVAALKPITLDKSGLQRMQLPAFRQTLDR